MMGINYLFADIFYGFLLLPGILSAQGLSKKPLDHSVYDHWEEIDTSLVSENGKWVAYIIKPQADDATLVWYNLTKHIKKSIARAEKPAFTADSRFLIFRITATQAIKDAAKAQKNSKKHLIPKDTLAILSLEDGALQKIPGIESFGLPKKGAGFIAYLIAKHKNDTIHTEKDTVDKKHKAGTLVVYDLTSGGKKYFNHVSDYKVGDYNTGVAFSVTPVRHSKHLPAMVLLYRPTNGNIDTIARGDKDYKGFSFSNNTGKLAFTGWRDSLPNGQKCYVLYYYSGNHGQAKQLVNDYTDAARTQIIAGDPKIHFSEDGGFLFFHTTAVRTSPDSMVVHLSPDDVNIWRYNDDYLLPMQLKQKERPGYETYLTAINLDDNKVIPLENTKISRVLLPKNGAYAIGISDAGYRIASQWMGSTLKTISLISLKDGNVKTIADSVNGRFFISPSGHYALWYDKYKKNWFSYDVKLGEVKNITRNVAVPLYDEENDRPELADPYGLAGWTDADQQVLLYDKYDVWEIDPTAKKLPKNITNGYGRKNNIVFRTTRLHKKDDILLSDNVLFLHALNEVNKDQGFYKIGPKTGKDPEQMITGSYKFSALHKAKHAEQFIFTKENYVHSPDVYLAGDLFKHITRLSKINPQQAAYNWGTAGLVHWTTFDGKPSTGILYKPENFDSTRAYPMIIYLYEKLSDRINNYIPPAPTPSRLNISFFVSRGYLVFCPDISYTIGHPGKSAFNYVISGIRSLSKHAWVDTARIGIQGQSWGGYEVAYLVTQTDLFRAAWAGAPVANMFSAYGGIRWGSGQSRQFQYEHGQSRIGYSIWDRPDLYMENSPLFHLPNVHTPLMIMANDHDGAVPWYQGIELFTALRRLGKQAWMLSYKGEEHNLVKRKNKLDISIREQQYFDYYLKGGPRPSWMKLE